MSSCWACRRVFFAPDDYTDDVHEQTAQGTSEAGCMLDCSHLEVGLHPQAFVPQGGCLAHSRLCPGVNPYAARTTVVRTCALCAKLSACISSTNAPKGYAAGFLRFQDEQPNAARTAQCSSCFRFSHIMSLVYAMIQIPPTTSPLHSLET